MINQSSKEFLIENLNRISLEFPEIRIRYELANNIHIIEIEPVSIFYDNNEYLRAELSIEKRFEELFPDEEILFISEDSLTKIENSMYEFGNGGMIYDFGISEPLQVTGYDIDFTNNTNFALAA